MTSLEPMARVKQMQGPRDIFRTLSANITKVITGKGEAVRLCLAAFAGGLHVLIEDVPGTGKTTLAKALARSVQLAVLVVWEA